MAQRSGGSEVGATWVLIAAAGSGERLGIDRPKAFAVLGERPLLAESLDRLERCELVAAKVVACVTGGATRAESVAAALAEVDEQALVVIVHDAARPLVDEALLERLLVPLAEGFDGAVPVLPVADTLKHVRDGGVVEPVDRDALVAAQTPQAFLAPILRQAFSGDLGGATDCAS